MTTREPERDPADRPEPGGDEIRADRVMHPDEHADAAPQPSDTASDEPWDPAESTPQDTSPPASQGDTVTATRHDTSAGADDRTQTLPAADEGPDTSYETDASADTDRTQVIGPAHDEADDGALDRTRTMPVVADEPAERSTDREAARARAEARRRPQPEPAVAAPVAAPAPQPAPAAERRVVVRNRRHITDRFDGAVAMFILRLVTAAIMGTWGVQMLMNLGATRDFFGKTMLPYPHWAALVTAVACVLIALALIIGLLVRIAGLGVLLIAVGSLVFVTWAPFHLFAKGQNGFVGEFEVALAAVGLLFLLIGGGGWGADRMFRSNKSKGLPEEEDDDVA